MQKATLEKVEEKGQSMILQLKCIIRDWERSGQGDGGVVNEPDTAAKALDDRKIFIYGNSTYLLYPWEILVTHGLLGSSMQHLNSSHSARNGANGVPSVFTQCRGSDVVDDGYSIASSLKSSTKKARRSDEHIINKLSSSIAQHGQSLIEAAQMAALQQEKDQLHLLRETRRNLVIRMALAHVMRDANVLRGIGEEIAKIYEEINQFFSLQTQNSQENQKRSNLSPA
jgi:hypothetical protein